VDRIEAVARDLRAADAAAALTGAGVSAPSGVPPFHGEDGISASSEGRSPSDRSSGQSPREDEASGGSSDVSDGVWSEYDPDAFDVWRFRRDPGEF
jgi:hypothetical protein